MNARSGFANDGSIHSRPVNHALKTLEKEARAIHGSRMDGTKALFQLKTLLRKLTSLFLVSFCAGIVLAILSPFGTNNLPITGRLIYWVGLCLAGGSGVALTDYLVKRFSLTLKPWQSILFGSFGATLMVCLFMFAMFPPRSLQGILITIFYVWVIGVVLCFIGTLIDLARQGSRTEGTPDLPPLMERLPLKLRDAELYAAVSEDHYVRVYTSKGDHLLLMRLGDVSDLAAPTQGLSPHRSWWVAKDGVEEIIRKSGKLNLHLKNGEHVPVSRSGAARIKEAGWLP